MAFSRSAIEAGRAYVRIEGDDSGLARTLSGSSLRLSQWNSKVGRLGGNLAASINGVADRIDAAAGRLATAGNRSLAFGAAGVGALAIPLKMAADLERAAISFEVFTGSAAAGKKILAELRETNLSKIMGLGSVSKVGQELLAGGLAAETLIDRLKRLGDISGGDQERFASLGRALWQVNQAGKLMGQERLQFVNAGFNPLEFIGRRTGETQAQIRVRMETGGISFKEVEQAIIDATSAGGRYFGLLDRQSQGLWGTLGRVKAAAVNAFTPIGETLGPIIKKLGELSISGLEWVQQATTKYAALAVPLGAIALAATGAGAALIGISVAGTLTAGVMTGCATAISLATVSLGLMGTAITFIASPIGIAVAGVTALGLAFIGFSDQGRAAIERIAGKWPQFQKSALHALESVTIALKSGNLKLAGEIAMAAFKVGWQGAWNEARQIAYDALDAITVETIKASNAMGLAHGVTKLMSIGVSPEEAAQRLEILNEDQKRGSYIQAVLEARNSKRDTGAKALDDAIKKLKELEDEARKAKSSAEDARNAAEDIGAKGSGSQKITAQTFAGGILGQLGHRLSSLTPGEKMASGVDKTTAALNTGGAAWKTYANTAATAAGKVTDAANGMANAAAGMKPNAPTQPSAPSPQPAPLKPQLPPSAIEAAKTANPAPSESAQAAASPTAAGNVIFEPKMPKTPAQWAAKAAAAATAERQKLKEIGGFSPEGTKRLIAIARQKVLDEQAAAARKAAEERQKRPNGEPRKPLGPVKAAELSPELEADSKAVRMANLVKDRASKNIQGYGHAILPSAMGSLPRDLIQLSETVRLQARAERFQRKTGTQLDPSVLPPSAFIGNQVPLSPRSLELANQTRAMLAATQSARDAAAGFTPGQKTHTRDDVAKDPRYKGLSKETQATIRNQRTGIRTDPFSIRPRIATDPLITRPGLALGGVPFPQSALDAARPGLRPSPDFTPGQKTHTRDDVAKDPRYQNLSAATQAAIRGQRSGIAIDPLALRPEQTRRAFPSVTVTPTVSTSADKATLAVLNQIRTAVETTANRKPEPATYGP